MEENQKSFFVYKHTNKINGKVYVGITSRKDVKIRWGTNGIGYKNNYHFLQASQQLFAGKMFPQPAGSRKCFPRVHQIPNFYTTGINKFMSHWQKCVDCNGSYFGK